MSKKVKIIVIVFLVITILGAAGYYSYSYYSRIQQRHIEEVNKDFCRDVILTLYDYHEEIKVDEETSTWRLEFWYRFRENILDAEDRMRKWESDENIFRREIEDEMLKGIDNLMIAAEQCIDSVRKPTEEESYTLCWVKIDEGRSDLFDGALSLASSLLKGDIRLSKPQIKELKNDIEFYFSEDKEFAEYLISGELKEPKVGQEVTYMPLAVMAIHHSLDILYKIDLDKFPDGIKE